MIKMVLLEYIRFSFLSQSNLEKCQKTEFSYHKKIGYAELKFSLPSAAFPIAYAELSLSTRKSATPSYNSRYLPAAFPIIELS
jgi:hypothetical protein